jgi:hypothetical protein
MDENIISWNVTNWVTVILMAAIGFAVLGLIQKMIQKHGMPDAMNVSAGPPPVQVS